MTVAALEAPAAPVAAGAGAALEARPRASAAGARSRARRPLPRGGAASSGRRAQTPPHQAWAPARPAARGRVTAGDVRRRLPATRTHRSNYQAVVLAEFAAAIVLVAVTPFASKDNPSGLSPYAGKDMLQLAAITVVYFLLALISVPGGTAARFAAWFGGLVLLTVGLSEAAHLAQVIDLTGIGTTKAQAKKEQEAEQ